MNCTDTSPFSNELFQGVFDADSQKPPFFKGGSFSLVSPRQVASSFEKI